MNLNSDVKNLKEQINQTLAQEVQVSAAEEVSMNASEPVANNTAKEQEDVSDLMNYIGLEIQRKGGQ